MSLFSFLQIRTAKDDETKPDSAQSLFSSIVPGSVPMWKRIVFGNPKTYSFEIYLLGQTVYFYAVTPKTRETFVKSLLQSSYPRASLSSTTDPFEIVKTKQIYTPHRAHTLKLILFAYPHIQRAWRRGQSYKLARLAIKTRPGSKGVYPGSCYAGTFQLAKARASLRQTNSL